MSDPGQRRFSVRPSVIRNIGIGLFVLSFIVPSGGALFVPTMGEHVRDYLHPFAGCAVFIQTPCAVTFIPLWRGEPIDTGLTPFEIFTRGVLFVAWLANFTVFFRLPSPAALLAIGLPWIAFICWFGFMAEFIPFYFWALGITLIHLSRMMGSWPNKSAEPVETRRSKSTSLGPRKLI